MPTESTTNARGAHLEMVTRRHAKQFEIAASHIRLRRQDTFRIKVYVAIMGEFPFKRLRIEQRYKGGGVAREKFRKTHDDVGIVCKWQGVVRLGLVEANHIAIRQYKPKLVIEVGPNSFPSKQRLGTDKCDWHRWNISLRSLR